MAEASEDHLKQFIQSVDDTLTHWTQGDCVCGEQWFPYRFNPQCHLTNVILENESYGGFDYDLAELEVRGFTVLTQTCDIVRSCRERPYLEVSPLVFISDEAKFNEIKKAQRPQYAYIPGLSEIKLVADLDRVTTVEKAVILGWERIQGCNSDDERRMLGQALSRKRIRCAFPDDFVEFAQKLQTRLKSKHDKDSVEGKGLRSLREIRVCASPSWDADEVELMFWYIRHQDHYDFQGRAWDELLEKWLKLVSCSGRFTKVNGQVITMEDLTAIAYVESDPLDLDHLSRSSTPMISEQISSSSQ